MKIAQISTSLVIQLPDVPNFLRVKMADGDIETMPIVGADEVELREIGRLWTEELVEKARRQGVLLSAAARRGRNGE